MRRPGRLVFGLAATLFGVIALIWQDTDTWQTASKIWSLPQGRLIGDALMAAQVAGGLGLVFSRSARPAAVLLCFVYAALCLAGVPGIVAYGNGYEPYVGFFEQFSLLVGAAAAYAGSAERSARSKMLARASRIGLGLCAVSFALAQIFFLRFTASLVPAWIPPSQMFWAVLTTVAFALAAAAMLTNIRAPLAARLLASMLGLFAILVWVPRLAAHPHSHGTWSEFALTVLIAGAAATVAELRAS